MAENEDNPSYECAAYRQMAAGWRIVDDRADESKSDSTVAAMDDYRRMMQKRA